MRTKDGAIEYCGVDLAVSNLAEAVPVIKAVMRVAGGAERQPD